MEVIFPCAPYAVCQEEDRDGEEDEEGEASKEGDEKNTSTCCQLTNFLSLNTTVALYNTHDIRDVQVINSAMLLFIFLKQYSTQEY